MYVAQTSTFFPAFKKLITKALIPLQTVIVVIIVIKLVPM